MIQSSFVVVAAKRTVKDTLRTAIARMPQSVPLPPDTQRILIKPSIYNPNLPGNTSLQMMRALTDFFKGVSPLSIVESDNPLRTAQDAFEKMGYIELMEENIDLVNLSKDRQMLTSFAGNALHQEFVSELLHKHKFLVNVATLKMQKEATLGAGIKNLFGLLGRVDKDKLHPQLNDILVDLLIKFRPSLSIIDLTDVVIGERKNMKSVPLGGVILGLDPVAVDAYCAHLLGFDPSKIDYIQRSFSAGLGEALPERIRVLGTEHQIRKVEDAIQSSTSP